MENTDLIGVSHGVLMGYTVRRITIPYYYSILSQCPERIYHC